MGHIGSLEVNVGRMTLTMNTLIISLAANFQMLACLLFYLFAACLFSFYLFPYVLTYIPHLLTFMYLIM